MCAIQCSFFGFPPNQLFKNPAEAHKHFQPCIPHSPSQVITRRIACLLSVFQLSFQYSQFFPPFSSTNSRTFSSPSSSSCFFLECTYYTFLFFVEAIYIREHDAFQFWKKRASQSQTKPHSQLNCFFFFRSNSKKPKLNP